MNLALLPVFLALGAFVGFLAGLLGIGGGFTTVPVLIELFSREGFASEHLVPMAIGTSAGTIVFTGVSSARAHHAQGRGELAVVGVDVARASSSARSSDRRSRAACRLRSWPARSAAFIWFGAYRMLRNRPPVASRQLPGRLGMSGVGAVIGMVAGMVGTGGAFLAVPFMTRCNVKLHTAVATSAAMSIPVAIAATIGFILAGWNKPGLPPYAIGYVYLPALVAIVVDQHVARAGRRAPGPRMAGRALALRVRGDAVLSRRLHVVEGVPLVER